MDTYSFQYGDPDNGNMIYGDEITFHFKPTDTHGDTLPPGLLESFSADTDLKVKICDDSVGVFGMVANIHYVKDESGEANFVTVTNGDSVLCTRSKTPVGFKYDISSITFEMHLKWVMKGFPRLFTAMVYGSTRTCDFVWRTFEQAALNTKPNPFTAVKAIQERDYCIQAVREAKWVDKRSDLSIHIKGMKNARTTLWSEEMLNLAFEGSEAFLGYKPTREDLDVGDQYWTFPLIENITNSEVVKDQRLIGFFLMSGYFITAPESIQNTDLRRIVEESGVKSLKLLMAVQASPDVACRNPLRLLPMVIGMGELIEGVEITEITQARIMGAILFMKLKIVEARNTVYDRVTRKQFEREKKPLPDVREIYLRQREYARTEKTGGTSGPKRDFQAAFWVGKVDPLTGKARLGFWRKAKSNSKTGKPEFVEAYIKGAGKGLPLHEPRETVGKVVR